MTSEVQLRSQEIQEIEEGFLILAEIFEDVEQLVREQEPVVENMESRAQNAVECVSKTNEILDDTVIKARKSRRKQWLVLVTIGSSVIIVIVMVVVAVKVALK